MSIFDNTSEGHGFTNSLINESSPYLLQHAHNPVNWHPWGEEALLKAKTGSKLLLVSIGYAACHWCHVMELECFGDEEVAGFMNDNFVAVKVDREERPDVDQVYMNAVQLITGSGGWPLNVICLPDGRPVYGGTYFPKQRWIAMLEQVLDFVRKNPGEAEQQAKSLTDGIRGSELIHENKETAEFTMDDLALIFSNWKKGIDFINGGLHRAPKFPLPVSYEFLLQYHFLSGDADALDAVATTLDKMSEGGIYDQLGGGFARYSTDALWKVPHFEKMLYDNAQLVSLYSKAYQLTKNPGYKAVAYETTAFVKRELTSAEGAFYSSLDADSEGEEGRFYAWKYDELKRILNNDAGLVIDYYSVTEDGNWENGNNILYRTIQGKDLAGIYNLPEPELMNRIKEAKMILLNERSKRIRPALDDKILTSWNAMMLKGYVDAYRVFDDEAFLSSAASNAHFILQNLKHPDDRLDRNFKTGRSPINGFLDDYAFTIDAFIGLYQASFDEKWLVEAGHLTAYALAHFYDERRGMFFYTSDLDPALLARKMEIADNVIPSANSVMAKNLFILGRMFYNDDYLARSKKMLNNIKQDTLQGGAYYANWDILMAWFACDPYEVVIAGDDFLSKRREFDRYYLPNVFLCGGREEGQLPILQGKPVKGPTTIYVCRDKMCKMPVTGVAEAVKQIL
ncbi:MAG: thioredoxin domain-containing protein [Bacteroidota bacterium]